MKTEFRTFLHPLPLLVPEHECEYVETTLDGLQKAHQTFYSSNMDFWENCVGSDVLKSRGGFREFVFDNIGYPNKEEYWSEIEGNKAKYARISINIIRELLLSVSERREVARICQMFDFDISQLPEIREVLVEKELYVTSTVLKNICRERKISPLPKVSLFRLDGTAEDSQISTVLCEDGVVYYTIRVGSKTIKFSFPIPANIRPQATGKWARPVIQVKDGEVVARFSYEVCVNYFTSNPSERILGVDLGVKKPFSACVNYGDGSYSTELLPTKELTRLNNKIQTLNTEVSRHYAKLRNLEQLLTHNPDPKLLQHYLDVRDNLDSVKKKRVRLKVAAAWIYARDLVNHAKENRCGVIKLENLSFLESKGGKWNFSGIQDKIITIASLENIEVQRVNARRTTGKDPFSVQVSNPKPDRTIDTVIGLLDRDYASSLEVSSREGKLVKPQRKIKRPKRGKPKPLKGKRCRDKHSPTPKRPKTRSRKSVLKEQVREIKELTKRSGSSESVEFSGVASLRTLHETETSHLMETSRPSINEYT